MSDVSTIPAPSRQAHLRAVRGLGHARVLVDCVWPRGLAQEHASVEVWMKGIALSAGLRTGFGQAPCTRASHMSIGKRTGSGRMRAVSRRHEYMICFNYLGDLS